RQPTIAALNGFTFGGGLELALACDLRIANEVVELAAPEVKIGTVPGWGGTQRLTRLIGAARAKQLILTGSRIGADKAEAWGMLEEALPGGDVLARGVGLGGEMVDTAPISVQTEKQITGGENGCGGGPPCGALAGALAGRTDEGKGGVASFREKRPPVFE